MKIMFFNFCKFAKTSKNLDFIFLQACKTSKNMDFIFYKLKKLKEHEFHFCKLKKSLKAWISFFTSLKKLIKHEFHFCQLEMRNLKSSSTPSWLRFSCIFCVSYDNSVCKCRMAMIFLRVQSPNPSHHFKYTEHGHGLYRKTFRRDWN